MTAKCVFEHFQLNTKRIKLRPVSSELRWNLRSSIGFARRPALELFCCGEYFGIQLCRIRFSGSEPQSYVPSTAVGDTGEISPSEGYPARTAGLQPLCQRRRIFFEQLDRKS